MLHDLAQENAVAVVPAALAYASRAKGAENSEACDVGWYGDMSFVPHLWGLMRRGGARCRIMFGAPIDPSACPDRKALARETQGSVRRLLAAGSFARAGVGL
jgi:1-acyl-sn-glycerol-3-phosphate acyltransferase